MNMCGGSWTPCICAFLQTCWRPRRMKTSQGQSRRCQTRHQACGGGALRSSVANIRPEINSSCVQKRGRPPKGKTEDAPAPSKAHAPKAAPVPGDIVDGASGPCCASDRKQILALKLMNTNEKGVTRATWEAAVARFSS